MLWGSGIKSGAVDTVRINQWVPPVAAPSRPVPSWGVGEGWPIVSLENDRGQLSWIKRATLEHPQTC